MISFQFRAVLPTADRKTRFLIETGTYDVPLITDARALRRELERRVQSVHSVESPEGHNHTAFRARLPAVLEALFPRKTPAVPAINCLEALPPGRYETRATRATNRRASRPPRAWLRHSSG